ncbi:MAG: ATP-dependent DNA helicase RecG [Candidatus Omnitrophica bacterium]|nr:ATP-dependent DNA helicase RecG [Candidatus Omnitrophota bacterium]
MKSTLLSPIQYLKGIGPKRAAKFSKLGINSIEDLLYYFPRRYEDRTKFASIKNLQDGQPQTIKAEVIAGGQRNSWRRRSFSITEALVKDESARISCVWFNRPYLRNYLKPGVKLIIHGKPELRPNGLQMNNPEFEIISEEDELLSAGRIVPVYSLPEGFSQRYFRRLVKQLLDEHLSQVNDCLVYDIRQRNSLLNLAQSLLNIHFPEDLNIQKQAYERLAFEEFFLFQIPLVLRKLKKKEKKGIAQKVSGELLEKFLKRMPFVLTNSQIKVVEEIKNDMARPTAMQRLLQGDVGSGKTVVAVIAAVIANHGGYQAAFMVPTEILAKQHFEKISAQIKELKIGLLVSSIDKKEKQKICQELKEGKINILIGTHALLEEGVQFKNLGLVVIDEQHKFGVGQRALLPQKGINPDCLIMTATPIPRTLAITIYGDLDVSIINELPPGRQPIKTMHFLKKQRLRAYDLVKLELKQGNQAYIVYPVIEESYALDMEGAKEMYQQLSLGAFKEFKLGLIHGKLKQQEQDEIMLKFRNKDLDVLVSTTVLEVGIDNPNATCMVVEEAQRFGLSQLHQLRGRVGRGEKQSFCLLISDAQGQEALARIQAMVEYNDGFKIAEEDLKIRGPGEFFGSRQHGLTELKIGDPLAQMQLLKRAREEGIKLLEHDLHLEMRQNAALREKLLQRFPEYEELVMVG